MSSHPLNGLIDHTLLKPQACRQDIEQICTEALTYQFASVFVLPYRVALVASLLQASPVKVGSVVSFPLGGNSSSAKAEEAKILVHSGAHEVDMVINIGALKDKDYKLVQQDIITVVQYAAPAIVKVIIETCLLSNEEKEIACKLCMEAGAHFVKTSTGFGQAGATIADVKLMRRVVGETCGVKASGCIKDYDFALALVEAGATRIGTSASVSIVEKKSALAGHY